MVTSGRDRKPEFQKIKKICGLTNLFIYYCSFDGQIDVQKKDLTLSLRVLSISDIVWEQSKLVLHYLNRTKQSGFLQFPSVQSSDSNPTVQRKYTQPALHPPINIICKTCSKTNPQSSEIYSLYGSMYTALEMFLIGYAGNYRPTRGTSNIGGSSFLIS